MQLLRSHPQPAESESPGVDPAIWIFTNVGNSDEHQAGEQGLDQSYLKCSSPPPDIISVTGELIRNANSGAPMAS